MSKQIYCKDCKYSEYNHGIIINDNVLKSSLAPGICSSPRRNCKSCYPNMPNCRTFFEPRKK